MTQRGACFWDVPRARRRPRMYSRQARACFFAALLQGF